MASGIDTPTNTSSTRSNPANEHPPPHRPSSGIGDAAAQTGVDQTAQRRRVSLPPSGTSPGDRRGEGLLFPPSSGLAPSRQRERVPRAPTAIFQTARRGGGVRSGVGPEVSSDATGNFNTGDKNKRQRRWTKRRWTHTKAVLNKVSVAASKFHPPPTFAISVFINIEFCTFNTSESVDAESRHGGGGGGVLSAGDGSS